jgi:hypothetical protein
VTMPATNQAIILRDGLPWTVSTHGARLVTRPYFRRSWHSGRPHPDQIFNDANDLLRIQHLPDPGAPSQS